MLIEKIENMLSDQEISYFLNMTDNLEIPLNDDGSFNYDENTGFSISKDLGRLQKTLREFKNEEVIIKLKKIARSFVDFDLSLNGASYVDYSAKYGTPNLPPHFDGDGTDIIINYQLKSNTSWDIGLNESVYKIEDNCALIFNPNESIHWRTKKIFEPGESVRMIFFRFANLKGSKDNSHLRYNLADEVYKSANIFRDSLAI
jgi:hypothetical protein